jgi:hypothetical protein
MGATRRLAAGLVALGVRSVDISDQLVIWCVHRTLPVDYGGRLVYDYSGTS